MVRGIDRAVEAMISGMSSKNSPSLWVDKGLRTKREWRVIRELSAQALKDMGYELEPPPPISI